MHIDNINDIEEFKIFLHSINSDECIFDIEKLLQNKNFDDFYTIKEGNRIIDFVNVYTQDGLSFVVPNFTNYKRQLEELELIKETFPNCILECDECYLNPEQKEYFLCKFPSTINKNYEYLLKYDTNFYVSDENDIFILRDNFEINHFPTLDLSNITFANVTQKQLGTFLKQYEIFGIPAWSNGNSWSMAGFHYFTPNEEGDPRAQYLLCLNGKNVLGVIKHSVYDEYDITHQCICYIDVNFAYREKGISKLLMKQMNLHLIEGLPLAITDESEMGKKCKMHKNFRKYVNKKIYTYKQLEKMQYEQHIKDIRNLHEK